MSSETLAIVFGFILLVLISGHPIGFGLGGLAIYVALVLWGPLHQFSPLFLHLLRGLMSNYLLVAVPLFIFMGCMLERSGVADALYDDMQVILGRLPGGLLIGTLVISILFAASSGITAASLTVLGLLGFPAMLKRGYDKRLTAGVIMSGGCLGILIPPSVLLILYAAFLNESVGALFAGAIFPGLLLGSIYIIYVLIKCRLRPHLGPAFPRQVWDVPWRKKILALTSSIPLILLIIAVLGSIFAGVATPTEAAGVGAFGTILLAAGHRRLTLHNFREATYLTMRIVGMVFILIIGASALQAVLSATGAGETIRNAMVGLELNRWVVIFLIQLILFFLGMMLDPTAILMIFVPLFVPVINILGFDTIWFALLYSVNMQMAFLTPPVGGALFMIKAVAPKEISMGDLIRSTPPFIALQATVLLIIAVFPPIVLWLPSILTNT